MTVKDITKYGIFISIVLVTTYSTQIPIGFAVVHAGDAVLFTIAVVFGKKAGAISGGIGMALFDVLSSFASYAPGTLVIRLLCGFVIGLIAHSNNKQGYSLIRNIIAMAVGSMIIVSGYFFYELLLYKNIGSASAGLVGNLAQVTFGLLVAIPIIKLVQRSIVK